LQFVLSKPPDRVKYTNLAVRRKDFEEIEALGIPAGILKGTAHFDDYCVRDVWMSFPGQRSADPIHVLERINLDVAHGEFVCIVDPSGCGKSTLLNIIAGFLRGSRGDITIDGEKLRGPDARRIFVFQENGVFPWLTVEANIGFGFRRLAADERNRIVGH
jgi:NitT/TauT family transport system ATP-binding protein